MVKDNCAHLSRELYSFYDISTYKDPTYNISPTIQVYNHNTNTIPFNALVYTHALQIGF